MRLDDIYRTHPFQMRTILARLHRQGHGGTIEEPDLAHDPRTEITDQNHVGGAAFVTELADAAGIGAMDLVVDVGCGLGGSCRVLAASRGCRVIGIETDSGRIADARQLTTLVNLDAAVRFVRADARAHPPLQAFDVLWGQSAWTHFDDKDGFLRRWCNHLSPRGRVAVEDAYLRRPPSDSADRALVSALEASWQATLVSLDGWHRALEGAGCHVTVTSDLTAPCLAYFQRLVDVSPQWPTGMLTPEERAGWTQALEAGASGLLGYCRLVATREAAPRRR